MDQNVAYESGRIVEKKKSRLHTISKRSSPRAGLLGVSIICRRRELVDIMTYKYTAGLPLRKTDNRYVFV